MNLEQNIKTYVRRRRANGVAFDKGEANLMSFAKQVGNVPLHAIAPILRVLGFAGISRRSGDAPCPFFFY